MLRYLIMALLLAAGILGVTYLQFRFDRSDLNHAVSAVRSARPGGQEDQTIEEKVHRNYQVPVEAISWVPEIESKVKGMVSVRVLLPNNAEELKFQVDLVRMAVVPMTPAATRLSQTKF